jgi:hypothetical protein
MKSKSHQNTRKLILDVLESGEKSLESVCELKRLHMHPLGKEKDGSRVEKRKKKSTKQEKHPSISSFTLHSILLLQRLSLIL